MKERPRARCLIALVPVLLAASAAAQYAERPHPLGSGAPGVDVSGRSVKTPRVRVVHSSDVTHLGSSASLIELDPFLAYQHGRNLLYREHRLRDGVLDEGAADIAGEMIDGTTAEFTRANQVSCLACHNVPYGNPGGGNVSAKHSGRGRKAPHFYGAGVLELLALQIRTELLAQIDLDGNGWVSIAEAQAAPEHVSVQSAPGGPQVDFGVPRLSHGASGKPRLDNVVRVWFVDATGRPVPGADEINGVATHGYGFALMLWGWGQGEEHDAMNPTLRAQVWDAFDTHMGMEAHDPATLRDSNADGVSDPTLAGAVQFPATHRAPDQGLAHDPLGFSRDDPDGDGYLNEVSEGDLDLAEWFALNLPRPAFAGTPEDYAAGVAGLNAMGCTACHVEEWEIRARDERFEGDRRFFDLVTRWNESRGRLEGTLDELHDVVDGRHVRRFGAFRVRGIFTDFRQHYMGAGLRETDYGGVKEGFWKTTPLWGTGSSFPWGHDGSALTLDDVILRHNGELGNSASLAWQNASESEREVVRDFLRKLVLYDLESLPTDVDGDGLIAKDFVVAGQKTLEERFHPEWLFVNPVRIQGPVLNAHGVRVHSFAATNLAEAYGLDLPFLVDSDLDGWADVWDAAPNQPGFRDGVE